MLLFLVTIGLGMARGIGLVSFDDRNVVLTHLHSGTIGWITLGIIATVLWLYGGTGAAGARRQPGDRDQSGPHRHRADLPTLFGLLHDLNVRRRAIWPWADHVLFWGMSLAVAAFTIAILTQAKGLYSFITPILGGSILIGIVTHTLRLRDNGG
jgi:hypothetical protein